MTVAVAVGSTVSWMLIACCPVLMDDGSDTSNQTFSNIQSEIVSAGKRITRAVLLEELTVAISVLPAKSMKKAVFTSDGFISFLFTEIADVNRSLRFYFTEWRMDANQNECLIDIISAGTEVPKEQYQTVKYGVALYTLLCKLICGSELVGAPRLNILLTGYNGLHLMPDILNQLVLEAPTAATAGGARPQTADSKLGGTVIAFGGGNLPPAEAQASQLELIGASYMSDVVERKQRLEQRKKERLTAAGEQVMEDGKTVAEKKQMADANQWSIANVRKAVDMIKLRVCCIDAALSATRLTGW